MKLALANKPRQSAAAFIGSCNGSQKLLAVQSASAKSSSDVKHTAVDGDKTRERTSPAAHALFLCSVCALSRSLSTLCSAALHPIYFLSLGIVQQD